MLSQQKAINAKENAQRFTIIWFKNIAYYFIVSSHYILGYCYIILHYIYC